MDFDDEEEEEEEEKEAFSVIKAEAGVIDDSIQTQSVYLRRSRPGASSFYMRYHIKQLAACMHRPPPSPSKRLRPVSEVLQPVVAPTHLQQQQTPEFVKRGHRSPSRK